MPTKLTSKPYKTIEYSRSTQTKRNVFTLTHLHFWISPNLQQTLQSSTSSTSSTWYQFSQKYPFFPSLSTLYQPHQHLKKEEKNTNLQYRTRPRHPSAKNPTLGTTEKVEVLLMKPAAMGTGTVRCTLCNILQ